VWNYGTLWASDDLTHWSQIGQLPVHDDPYKALLNAESNDPSVTGRNFDNTGQVMWLYWVHIDPGNVPRHVMREKIRLDGTVASTMTPGMQKNLANALSALEGALKTLLGVLVR
jgi:hypothetical protein